MKFGACVAGGCRWQRVVLLWALAGMAPAHALDAASLTARHSALREQLASNQFNRPLYLESLETAGRLKGDIYAQIEQPFGVVAPALQGMDRWCDILILHLNVKGCRASSPKAGDTLSVSIGRKFDQPLDDAYGFEFLYRVVTASADYLQVVLSADEGPLGTSAYRVVLEVVPLDARRSFLHLSYAYAYGMTARLAMQGYLGTIGRNKVGFSVTGHTADGRPVYIAGTRGAIERNTMRYYLAIEAYLGALSAPPAKQAEKRLNAWFDGVERYPAQLHEMERGEYLDMKRREIARQQAPGPTATTK